MKFSNRKYKFSIFTTILAYMLIFSMFSASAVTYVSYGDYKYAKIADFKVYVAQYTGSDSKYYFSVPASPSAGITTTGVYQSFMKDNTDIKSITLPDTVEVIQQLAFSGCSSLTDFSAPVNLSTIGDNAFSKSGISNVQFNNKLRVIGNSAFSYNSNLEIVEFPKTMNSIGLGAFSNCPNLKFVTIPASVKTIGEGAFLNCNKNLIIYGEKRTAAEVYANDNNITFIPSVDHYFGDLDLDEVVSIKDTTFIMKSSVRMDGYEIEDGTDLKLRGDVDGNGIINVKDATYIQKYVNHEIDKFPVEH